MNPPRSPIIVGDIAKVPLTRAMEAIIDASDAALVGQYNWQARPGPSPFIYAVRSYWIGDGRLATQRMHRLILDAPDGMFVDHINGDGLDNRRSNIRLCTPQENARNARIFSSNKVGAKGVHMIGPGRYRARISIGGKKLSLGVFSTLQEASAAYDAAAIEHFGEFAKLNKIEVAA